MTSLVEYHVSNGGISRYKKLAHFSETILNAPNPEALTETLLAQYGEYVFNALPACEEAPCLREFLSLLNKRHTCAVVSGGDEIELNNVFSKKGLSHLFQSINGSPRNKVEIIDALKDKGILANNPVFVGDAKYDYEAAQHFGMDFIFLTEMSEFDGWKAFFDKKNVLILNGLCDIANLYNETR